MDDTSVYTAEHIHVCDSIDAIRRRPGMYIGDVTGSEGTHHLLWELVANSLDEHLAGRASKIRVSVEANVAEVEDDGRGIPVDPYRDSGVSVLEWILTNFHNGATLDGHLPHVHVSPAGFGAGLTVVNALSEALEVEVRRGGFVWTQRYARGRALGPLERGARTERTGTRVRFQPDASIFAAPRFEPGGIREHLEALAIWNPGLLFDFMSQPIQEPRGTVGWLDRLAAEHGMECSAEPFVVRTLRDGTLVEVAAAWSTDESERDLRSFVGQRQTHEGGSHETGFWQGLADALARRHPDMFQRPLRNSRLRVLAPGLLAVVHVALGDPQFAGPTRDQLKSLEARHAVRAVVGEAFGRHLEAHPLLDAMLLARIRRPRED